jgi:hypothetical protein
LNQTLTQQFEEWREWPLQKHWRVSLPNYVFTFTSQQMQIHSVFLMSIAEEFSTAWMLMRLVMSSQAAGSFHTTISSITENNFLFRLVSLSKLSALEEQRYYS